jgi:hypothetical protein
VISSVLNLFLGSQSKLHAVLAPIIWRSAELNHCGIGVILKIRTKLVIAAEFFQELVN